MADEAKGAEEQSKKKGGLKNLIVVGGLLLVEGVAIVGAMMFLGGPDVTEGAVTQVDPALVEDEKIVEVLVLDGKLANAKSGIGYLYSTEIYIQVKKRNEEQVAGTVDQFNNEIKSQIAAIWRTSEPSHFREPKLESLTRKVHALLDERFGLDETGEPVLVKVVLVMGTGLRVDY